MEQPNDESTVVSSLLILNNHCILEISKYLELYDTINLSKACHRLKSLAETQMLRKFTELTIDRAMIMSGKSFVNDVLSHVGSHLVRLECALQGVIVNYFWPIINNKCKHLKEVELAEWNERTLQDYSHFTCFGSVEVLSLVDCKFHSSSNFLASFRSLKNLWSENGLDASMVTTLFRNNRNLIDFSFNANHFDDWEMDMRCFDMVPKLEELRIDLPDASEYTTLVNMNLKKLELWCTDTNINDLLIQLAEKGLLEKLDLKFADLGKRSFEILKRFTKMQSLVIVNYSEHEKELQIMPSFGWPENLTELNLDGLPILFDTFLSAIAQLKCLEKIDLWRAHCVENEVAIFNDFDYLCKRILKAINHRDERKLLTVVLPIDVRCGRDGSQVN